MTGRKFLSPPSYGSLRSPITGVPRARKLKLFSIWPAAVLFRAKLARPTKSTRAGSCATTDDRAQISQTPLLWLAPKLFSNNPITGVPRARKLKLLSIWPAAVLFRAKLARPTKSTRAGSCATTDDRAQISQPPPLMARSAIRSRECRVRGN